MFSHEFYMYKKKTADMNFTRPMKPFDTNIDSFGDINRCQ
jgi:hypothetical protein